MVRLFCIIAALLVAVSSSAGTYAPRKNVDAAVVGGGTTVSDNFNRSDENPLSGSGVWTNPGGSYVSLKILSNQVTATSASVGLAFYNTPTFSADQYSQAKVVTNDNAYAGVVVRCNSGGTDFYRAYVEWGDVKISRRRGDGNNTTWTVASGQNVANKVLKLSASGASSVTLKVYIDSVQVGSDTVDNSSYVVTSGQPGIHTPSAGTLDDFQAGEL